MILFLGFVFLIFVKFPFLFFWLLLVLLQLLLRAVYSTFICYLKTRTSCLELDFVNVSLLEFLKISEPVIHRG